MPNRHMVTCSIGLDTAIVCVLAVYEHYVDPANPATTHFDVVQLQRLSGLTHPKVVEQVGLTIRRPPIPGGEWDLCIDETVIHGVGTSFNGLGKIPKRVVVTGGTAASQDGQLWAIGWPVLLSKLTTVLHQGEFAIAQDLTEAPALATAILDARTRPTDTIDHNPLLFTATIGLWHADKWWRGRINRRAPRVIR